MHGALPMSPGGIEYHTWAFRNPLMQATSMEHVPMSNDTHIDLANLDLSPTEMQAMGHLVVARSVAIWLRWMQIPSLAITPVSKLCADR